MRVKILSEYGFEESVLGFSLSYNTSIERAKEILPKYAFKNNGENKFLRSMQVWLDINAPRFMLTELDTYKVSTTRLSESTMHTLSKTPFNNSMFEYQLEDYELESLEKYRLLYLNEEISLGKFKSKLPEGFLQRIVFNCNYANLQNMYFQRKKHKLSEWNYLLAEILSQIQHPEFIKPPEDK